MAWEQDYYDVYEAARVLGIPPARVRKMLRAGELQGERGEQIVEGPLGRGGYRPAPCTRPGR